MVFFKTFIFTVLVPGTVAVYLPWQIVKSASPALAFEPGALRYVAVAPCLAGAAIYFWCAWDFAAKGRGTPAPIDAPRVLVVEGLYRYVRNPMYIGVLLVLLGEAIWFGSIALLLYGAAICVMFNLFIRLYEEPTLRKLFGESYRDYCARVPRWIPRPPR